MNNKEEEEEEEEEEGYWPFSYVIVYNRFNVFPPSDSLGRKKGSKGSWLEIRYIEKEKEVRGMIEEKNGC